MLIHLSFEQEVYQINHDTDNILNFIFINLGFESKRSNLKKDIDSFISFLKHTYCIL